MWDSAWLCWGPHERWYHNSSSTFTEEITWWDRRLGMEDLRKPEIRNGPVLLFYNHLLPQELTGVPQALHESVLRPAIPVIYLSVARPHLLRVLPPPNIATLGIKLQTHEQLQDIHTTCSNYGSHVLVRTLSMLKTADFSMYPPMSESRRTL